MRGGNIFERSTSGIEGRIGWRSKRSLNEFCRNAGYHRKYSIRLLNGPRPRTGPEKVVRRRGCSYGPQALSILTQVWEAAAYPGSARQKVLLPKWMPWIRRCFRVSGEIERQLLRISARQIDRRLRAKKTEKKRRIHGRTKPGLLLKHQIAVKTVRKIRAGSKLRRGLRPAANSVGAGGVLPAGLCATRGGTEAPGEDGGSVSSGTGDRAEVRWHLQMGESPLEPTADPGQSSKANEAGKRL